MSDWLEFFDTKIKKLIDDKGVLVSALINTAYEVFKTINNVEKLKQKNKELENRLIKLEDYIVERLHDKVE